MNRKLRIDAGRHPARVSDDPSHALRFWSPTEGGEKYRVYEQQVSSKNVDLTVEHYSHTIVTSTVGIRKITV